MSNFFQIYGFLPSYTNIYEGAYTVTQTYPASGYYNYTFSQPVFFPRKTVMNLKFISGSIALDTSGLYNTYSDLEWNRGTNASLVTNIYTSIFYLNIITTESLDSNGYQSISARKKYNSYGFMVVHSQILCGQNVTDDLHILVTDGKN